jgi:hypothetical protein
MVDVVQLVAAAAGFGPALALMFYTLRDYTFPKVEKPFFDDRKMFAFFALGIVLGMVLFAFEAWGQTVSVTETFLLLVIGFAAMEELLKLVILNWRKFQKKVDTAFYGLSMGLGISATFAFANIYSAALGVEDLQWYELLGFSLLGMMFVPLHGATTALIGVGAARGEAIGYFAEALLIHLSFGLLYESFFLASDLGSPLDTLGFVGLAAAAIIAVYGYFKVHTLSLPALVRDAKRLARS